MIRNRILLKSLAVFFVMEMFVSTVLPTLSWALTAGPTAPEATSFEPVDTTDMVNLNTGDFVYNIPLLEVPGPSGGYPLSLSYHAGIQPGQDASWVGLGWALNPGAINRSVNGYVDDHENVIGSDRSFWEGGKSESFTIGVNVGYGSMASVSAGLQFAEDTYRGSGVGYYYGAGLSEHYGPGKSLSTNLQFTRGVSPYGDSFSSSGLSVGIGGGTKSGLGISGNIGVSFDQDGKATGTASAGVSYSSQGHVSNGSVLDASISTSGGGSFGAGGIGKGVNNANSGKISSKGYNYSADIPTPWNCSIRLGKSYQRYWTDETANVLTNGSLYFPTISPTSASLDNRAFDVYDLQIPGALDSQSPEESLTGAFADYDSYTVLGQGISGGIRPYHYKSYLVRQNNNDPKHKMKSYPLGISPMASFRFEGDFSNRYEHDPTLDAFVSDASNPLAFTFNSNKKTGENENEAFNDATNVLPGSKHVEWFTNTQINDNNRVDTLGQSVPPGPDAAISKGFINCKALGFTREDSKQIGGFKVINESGVTYHYALPVYSYDEHQYSGRVDEQNKHLFNLYKKPEKYAYTWLLTAVTGPDFVDKNHNGFADEADWGYWVTFEYGKWTGAYSWRNPPVGFNKDIDQNFDNFSKGKKETYYLNAVRTKTHTAIFVKELRADGKGVVHKLPEAIHTNLGKHTVGDIDYGSFTKLDKTGYGGTSYTEYPVSTLKLHSIYLLQNKDFASHEPISNLATVGNVYYHSQNQSADFGKYTYGKNVIDIHDLENASFKSEIKSKCLKKIELKTDYSLCRNTPNSYWSELDIMNTSEAVSGLLGKLTLNALKIYGRGEADLIPELKFKYDNPFSFNGSMDVRPLVDLNTNQTWVEIWSNVQNFNNLTFTKGEIVVYKKNNQSYYAYIADIFEGSGQILMYPISSNWVLLSDESLTTFEKTKNPPYGNAVDLWGLYKVDHHFGPIDPNASENVKKMTTKVSAQSVDVWSLREITTSLGAKVKVEYESDIYKSALKSLSNIPIKSIALTNEGKTKVTLYEDLEEYDLKQGDDINLRFLTAVRYDIIDPGFLSNLRFNCNGDQTYIYKWYSDNTWGLPTYKIEIESADNNSFVVDYNFKNRYPAGGNICLEEAPPYSEEHPTVSNASTCIDMDYLSQSAPIFLGGEIISNNIFSPYGGDLRVKKLSVEQMGQTRSTVYEYFNGITSYEPMGFAIPVKKISGNLTQCLHDNENVAFNNYRQLYFDDVYKKFQMLFVNSRELPGPCVMYEWVRVKEQIERQEGVTQLDGKAEYQFEVFSPKTLDISISGTSSTNNPIYSRITSFTGFGNPQLKTNLNNTVFGLPIKDVETSQSDKTTIKDFTAIMGSLKRMILYDKNNFKISETIHHYLHDEFNETNFLNGLQGFKNQGVIAETFADARVILNDKVNPADPDSYNLYGIISQRIKYPNIQIGETTINYKTGIRNTSKNLGFDFYSGQVVKTSSKDGYGNEYVAESVPAYRAFPEMGLAYAGNKNMLTQEASALSYRINQNNEKGLVSATTQTWSKNIPILGMAQPDQYKIWRKQSIYSWIGDDVNLVDGLYPYANFSAFNFSDISSNSVQWQKGSEIKLNDIYSHALEAVDINENFAATKMSSDHSQVLATVANSTYNEFAYSGSEDIPVAGAYGGSVQKLDGTEVQQINESDVTSTHTGRKAVQLTAPGQKTFKYSFAASANKKYHASVWVNSSNGRLYYKLNGVVTSSPAVPSEAKKAGSWYLIETDIPSGGSTGTLEVWCETAGGICNFDDFRVHPYNAAMISYVYNEWGELSHSLDNNNLYTHYVYNGMGSLIETHKETFQHEVVKVSEIKYNYSQK